MNSPDQGRAYGENCSSTAMPRYQVQPQPPSAWRDKTHVSTCWTVIDQHVIGISSCTLRPAARQDIKDSTGALGGVAGGVLGGALGGVAGGVLGGVLSSGGARGKGRPRYLILATPICRVHNGMHPATLTP